MATAVDYYQVKCLDWFSGYHCRMKWAICSFVEEGPLRYWQEASIIHYVKYPNDLGMIYNDSNNFGTICRCYYPEIYDRFRNYNKTVNWLKEGF